MAIDVRELSNRVLDPAIADELDTYERTVGEYLDGRVDEDVFRVFRLNQGVYGQRQGGHNQMLRVKVPHVRVTAEQLDTFAYLAENYSAAGATSPPVRTCSSTSSSSRRLPRSSACWLRWA